MDYKLQSVKCRGRPQKTWKEVVQRHCQTQQLNKEHATDHNK